MCEGMMQGRIAAADASAGEFPHNIPGAFAVLWEILGKMLKNFDPRHLAF